MLDTSSSAGSGALPGSAISDAMVEEIAVIGFVPVPVDSFVSGENSAHWLVFGEYSEGPT